MLNLDYYFYLCDIISDIKINSIYDNIIYTLVSCHVLWFRDPTIINQTHINDFNAVNCFNINSFMIRISYSCINVLQLFSKSLFPILFF